MDCTDDSLNQSDFDDCPVTETIQQHKKSFGKTVRYDATHKSTKGYHYHTNQPFLIIPKRQFKYNVANYIYVPKTELDTLCNIPIYRWCYHFFSLGKHNNWTKAFDYLELHGQNKFIKYSLDTRCWYISYDLPISDYVAYENMYDSKRYHDHFVVYLSKSDDDNPEYFASYYDNINFDDITITPIKFKLYPTIGNRDHTILKSQIYRRNVVTTFPNKHVNMNDIVVNFKKNTNITHLEFAGDSILATLSEQLTIITSTENINNTPYIKSCEMFYMDIQTDHWVSCGIIKCNNNAFDPVLVDLKPFVGTTNGCYTRRIRLKPKDWHIAPIFRIAIYGHQRIDKCFQKTELNEYVTYEFYIPRPIHETTFYPANYRCHIYYDKDIRNRRKKSYGRRKMKKDLFLKDMNDNLFL